MSEGDHPTDDGVIRCICGISDDDGLTIQCDGCMVWQHMACMRIHKDRVPEKYYCEQCDPRPVDVEFAKELQRRRRLPKPQRRRVKDHSSLQTSLSSAPANNNNISNSNNSKAAQGSQAPQSPVLLAANHKSSSKIKSSANVNYSQQAQPSKASIAPSGLQSYFDDDGDDFFDITEDYIPIIKNMGQLPADLSQEFLSKAGPDICIASHLIDSAIDCIPGPISTVELSRYTIQSIQSSRSTIKLGILADEDFTEPHQFIMECRGRWTSRSDFQSTLRSSSVSCDDGHFYFRCPHKDWILDARHYGNEARFLRFSCDPNTELRWMTHISLPTNADIDEKKGTDEDSLIKSEESAGQESSAEAGGRLALLDTPPTSQNLSLGVFSRRPILKGGEITVPYAGQDYGKASLDCACSNYDTCLFVARKGKPETDGSADRPESPVHISRPESSATASEANSSQAGSRHPSHSSDSESDHDNKTLENSTLTASRSRSKDTEENYKIPDRRENNITVSEGRSVEDEDIFHKPDHLLSREERKIRDELVRFARMEQRTQFKKKRKNRDGSDKITASKEQAAIPKLSTMQLERDRRNGQVNDDSSEHSSTMSDANSRKRRRVHSRNHSRVSSASGSPVRERGLFPYQMKKIWLQQFVEKHGKWWDDGTMASPPISVSEMPVQPDGDEMEIDVVKVDRVSDSPTPAGDKSRRSIDMSAENIQTSTALEPHVSADQNEPLSQHPLQSVSSTESVNSLTDQSTEEVPTSSLPAVDSKPAVETSNLTTDKVVSAAESTRLSLKDYKKRKTSGGPGASLTLTSSLTESNGSSMDNLIFPPAPTSSSNPTSNVNGDTTVPFVVAKVNEVDINNTLPEAVEIASTRTLPHA